MKHSLKDPDEAMASSSGGSSLDHPTMSSRVEKSVARGGDYAEEPKEGGQESVILERTGDYSAICRWTIAQFSKVKARALWSRYFEVGGYDCRLLVYPKGDSQALPGYLSIYLQIVDPRGSSSSKWDCFASYKLCVLNQRDETKSIQRDSWHRFSSKKKSHGWCDFTPSSSILDPKAGFLLNDSVIITVDILVLNESVFFSRDNELQPGIAPLPDVLSGKFTWKVHNFSLFKEMIKTQKIMSPVFPAGECNLRLSVYQSSVNGVEYLSMCLESKDTEKSVLPDRSCWCLFRMSVLNQKVGGNHMHRDSYGRFAADNKSGDNTSLGWNDYMKMSDFMALEGGYLLDDTAVFSASFHVIKELSNFTKNPGLIGVRANARKSDGHLGKFTWRIENFTRLKDLLKKRKITGLCVKSRRFQVGNRDCRLIVYPRGQSQPPCHLSVFLEVTDPRNTAADWSCFVSHRLSVVNQRMEEKSVTKESQNRYSKAAKDWGWREFVTLTSLFDQDSGFLVMDTVVFSAEVLILKETSTLQEAGDYENDLNSIGSNSGSVAQRGTFTWKVENFLSFKEIMETRKIFSKFFQAGGCELRIGVYESFDTLCIYLESDQSAGSDPDKNFWVRYRMAVVNQKNPSKTVWKESSICTKTWNNSVLQFMKVSDMLEQDAGFLVRDTVVFVCEIMDCCPWLEFSDLEVMASDDDRDALSTDPDELIDSDESEGASGDEEDVFRNLLARAGFHLTYGDNPPLLLDPSQLQVTLREKLLMDAGAIAAFLTGLRIYLDDPAKVRRLLLPTKLSSSNGGKKGANKNESSPSLINLLMGVKVLQQAIIDLLLDIMVEYCRPSEGRKDDDSSHSRTSGFPNDKVSSESRERNGEGRKGEDGSHVRSSGTPNEKISSEFRDRTGEGRKGEDGSQVRSTGVPNDKIASESRERNGILEPLAKPLDQRLDDGSCNAQAVQSSDLIMAETVGEVVPGQPATPPKVTAEDHLSADNLSHTAKAKWPDQTEELLGLIVNSLRALDCAVPQGCPEPRRSPHSAQKIALVLDRAPKHLQPDLITLVPKLVDHSEHPLAACALLDRLQKPVVELPLLLPVLSSLSQLELSKEMWEQVLFQSFKLLTSFNDEPLAATITFVFKAASKCQLLPHAVRAIRARLRSLGLGVSPSVLTVLRKAATTQPDTAEAFLRDIGSESDRFAKDLTTQSGLSDGEYGFGTQRLHDDMGLCCHVADVDILIEMLSIPSLVIEASQVCERAIAKGVFDDQTMLLVLERRHSIRLMMMSSRRLESTTQDKETGISDGAKSQPLWEEDDDFAPVLGLAEALAPSRDSRVMCFVRGLYGIMFRLYSDEGCRERLLRGLVERAASSANSCQDVDLDMEILVYLVRENEMTARTVLNMMREVAELASADRASLWHQLCATEEEIIRAREEMRTELSNLLKDKVSLTQRLNESEVLNTRLKSEMKAEQDCFGREKKDLCEQFQEVENQLEWVRVERLEEVSKLSADKKSLQERLHDAETQLSQLKSRKRDELKRVMKEKNVLAERLKNAEAARKRFDEELKRFATETVTREEVRQSLEDEVRRLTQTVGQTEGGLREKEKQVAQCEEYINNIESKLQTCEKYIQDLEASLQEEMSRHAPLYGAGLEALSSTELETVARIHEEGLRQVHTLLHQRKAASSAGPTPEVLVMNMDPLVGHGPGPPISLFGGPPGTPPPSMALGVPPLIPNGHHHHHHHHPMQGNGHINGPHQGQWFPST
ncbi:hypothetical protein AMTRI_Chr12g272620 [Amborella trichopoda]|uniref:uncharacterized protein LOC18446935 n=1 Tax=Amborella trichopoda TaxID=13333 RepID=UPI0005D3F074|nr:uncharacterized protein LOC18446935 [Amborella trichopoda]XP_011628025.1 uncharacterized protein LOC18446935 [Amborella trichopoda]|eukprot:XP_011628024.1 uncharacterized protein LOC18446935 [Amborella trichopoda]